MELIQLFHAIKRKLLEMPNNVNNKFESKYLFVLNDPIIKDLIEWEIPCVSNLDKQLNLDQGEINAIRLDLYKNDVGMKKPVIGSLLVRHLIQRRRISSVPKGIIDGGNVNTGLALSYFANKFSINAALIHSRYFPQYIKNYLEKYIKGNLDLIEAPASNLGREREFYKYLINIIRSHPVYKNYLCLWHAKYGGRSLVPFGRELAKKIEKIPDYIVLSLGSGSTLEGIAVQIKKYFNGKPKIVIIEHEKSHLLKKDIIKDLSFNYITQKNFNNSWVVIPPNGIPHAVLGPHYDEINSLLDKSVLEEVDYIYCYSDKQWKWMASYCKDINFSIGNSSAANLVVSRAIAEKNKRVLTIINEPFRSFYENISNPQKSLNSSENFIKLND